MRNNIIARSGLLSPGFWTALLYVPINQSLYIKPVIVFKYYAIRSISYSEIVISSHYMQYPVPVYIIYISTISENN